MSENDPRSTSDDRQPFHRVDGNILTQGEWRLKLGNAIALLDAFKRQAYKDHEI